MADIFGWLSVGLVAELLEAETRFHQVQIVVQLFVCVLVDVALRRFRFTGARIESPRDVGGIAERTDHVRVEGNQLRGADDALTRFVHPRHRPISGGDQAAVYPVAAHANVGGMQDGPEIVLGHPGPQRLAHSSHADLRGADGDVHAHDLLGRFDRARMFH